MLRYAYTAKVDSRQTVQGVIDADSEPEAINKLSRKGHFPLSLQAEDLSAQSPGAMARRRVANKELVIFTRQLAGLVGSGVNILKSLSIIAGQTQNKYLKAVITDVAGKIRDGKPLSNTLAAYPHLFTSLYTSIIHSGEVSGNLEQALKRLADFLDKEEEFANSVKAAMTYPLFVFAVGVLTVIILMGFVIPKLVVMFEDMGQALPVSTTILISASHFFSSWWWAMLAVSLAFFFALRRAVRNPAGRLFVDSLKIRAALFKDIILKTEISRLMRTLSLLLSSGVSPVYALETASSVLNNSVLKLEAASFKEKIISGISFSRCLNESRYFPAFVTNIVTVGEETGSLDKALLSIAEEYEKEVERALKVVTRLLEPMMILVMGVVVGFIVMSMLLPIFQINLTVR